MSMSNSISVSAQMPSWLKIGGGLLAVLLIWEIGVIAADVPEYILPPPSEVAIRWWQTLPAQIYHLSMTGLTTLAGLALATVIGVLLALLVVYVRSLRAVVVSVLAAFNGIPKVAIAPLFVVWFGLGLEAKILLAFLLALFPIFVNSLTGLDEIESDVLDLSRLAGGTPMRMFRKIRLMNAIPYITDALKVAFPLALVGSIVGEFIGGNIGIGYLILSAQFNLDTSLVFASLVSITAFTSLGVGVIAAYENAFLKWRPSRRR
ncbi:MAG: ABC transporter permease [Rhizobiaceae bacterium]|nr:ABC transporter permease [Rhizobiaceae bacterium]